MERMSAYDNQQYCDKCKAAILLEKKADREERTRQIIQRGREVSYRAKRNCEKLLEESRIISLRIQSGDNIHNTQQ